VRWQDGGEHAIVFPEHQELGDLTQTEEEHPSIRKTWRQVQDGPLEEVYLEQRNF
jgi:hypothetical protein